MANDNSVTIIGNCTRDPELRYTNSGMQVASFGVAYNTRKRNNETGQWEDGETSFFDITCFRELAENVAETISKGTRVVVFGSLRQRSWETPDGDKRSKVEVIADEVGPSLRWATATVERVGRSEGGRGGGGGAPAAAPSGPSYNEYEEPF
ncbi:MAG: single-stranded DNA-binding protein [Acidimicrobiia bacterium]|jgi:single-strand DNA-binding protein|nr:single-stranded DNA-binding protein [Acidimicrobiia bacterium]